MLTLFTRRLLTGSGSGGKAGRRIQWNEERFKYVDFGGVREGNVFS